MKVLVFYYWNSVGKSNTDAVLAEKNFILNKTDGKTLKCLFDKSVLLKAEV